MRGIRYSIGLVLAAAWIAPLRAQEPGGSIRGHVTGEASQQPLQGAVVRVGSRSTQTRTDGGDLLPGVPSGRTPSGYDDLLHAGCTRVPVAEGENRPGRCH